MTATPPQRAFLVYAASYAAAGAIPFVLLPILTKQLTPEQFGVMTSFLVLAALLANVAGLSVHGFVAAKYYKMPQADFGPLVSTSLATVAIVHMAAIGVIAIAYPYLEPLLGVSMEYAFLAVGAGFLVTLNLTILAYFQFSGRPWRYFKLRAIQAGLELSLCMALVWLVTADAGARIWSYLVALIISAIVGSVACAREGLLVPRWDRASARGLLRFGLPLLPHVAAGMTISYADRLLTSSLLGVDGLGIYMVGMQVGMAMVALIEPLNKALVPWLFKQLSMNDENIKRMVVKRTYQLYGVLLLCGLAIAVVAHLGFDHFIGTRFSMAKSLLPWMIGGYILQGMYYSVVNYFYYAERTGVLTMVTGSIAFAGCAISYSLIKFVGLLGAGIAFLLNNLLLFVLVWFAASKVVRMPWFRWRHA
ncbi:lipopolysaccharide biosynthesis protein [Piscinibacter terrae]|uniref:Polysaccharide biosynthesis protein n=1 Tax=Piscinibacter terrae TaxID=2496871 RepID=A0A3N7HHW4_9BURK|nr:oligosaccharide flippase family protein [Albitalea terrae]RQP21618.1 hypothetical protein DZC73_27310 [Albitalea terrae]